MAIIADISKWQGTINFDKLVNVVDGVILRVQAGSTYKDPLYQTYVSECKRVGLKFGTYAYFCGVSVDDAIQEAKDCLARTDKDSLFIAVDIEEVSMTDLVAGGTAFIKYLKDNGVQHVGLYSGEYFYKKYNLAAIPNDDFQWIANYGVNNGQQNTQPATPDDDLWQFTSVGKLDGINTAVDLNVVTNPVEFPFFEKAVQIAQPVAKPLMTVKVLVPTDVRADTDHASGYVGNVYPDQMYNVWAIKNDWHYIILDPATNTCGWVDGNNGKNLYWLDNPALKAAPAPTTQTYVARSGDTASKLAAMYGAGLANIKAWNNLDSRYTIYAGKSYRVK